MGGKTYDKRHRENKERESFKKRIRKLRDLPKLPEAQLNRILGFDKEGKKIENNEAYQEAYDLVHFLSNYTGLGSELIRENGYLREENKDLKKTIKYLEKTIEKQTGISASVKIEPGLLFEPYPHMLYLTEQFICPKCQQSGLPIYWKRPSDLPARWLWLHFGEVKEMLEYSWERPKITTHLIKKGGLGNWWEANTHQDEFRTCFLFGGKASRIQHSLLISESYIK